MADNDTSTQKQIAIRIAASTNAVEKEAIRVWIDQLLSIKRSELPAIQKAKQAVSVTADSRVILPTVKIIGREVKRLAWDDRSVKARFGLGGAAIGLAVFGGQGAGIAALGTAIGVPLWVVFGAGATFLGVLYEEITEMREAPKADHAPVDPASDEDRSGPSE